MPIVSVKDCSLGFFPDMLPEELASGAWSNVRNMRFRAGFAERFRGMTNIFGNPSATPYGIIQYSSIAKRYWVTACLAKMFAYDGTAEFDITPVSPPTGGIDDRYTMSVFNGVLISNNGKDIPWQWGGATGTPAAGLSNWPGTWRAKSIRPFKNFLVALNVAKGSNVYPHMVAWSSAAVPGAVPGSWTPAPSNEAGDIDLAETGDLIVDALVLGDQLIIYKERSMYSMRYAPGNSDIFTFQRIPGETGLLAPNCVADTPIGHVVLTNGDVVVHQGQQATSIADGSIRKWIFNQMNSLYPQRCFVTTNPQKSEVLICFPTTDSETCNKAAVYNWISRSWGTRDLVATTAGATGQINADSALLNWEAFTDTWEAYPQAWDENEYTASEARLLLARVTQITAFDVGATDFGNPIVSLLERTGDYMGDADTVKLLKGTRPRIDANTGTQINVTIGGALYSTAAPIWKSPVPFIVGAQKQADDRASGRYLTYRFEGVGFDPWRLRSFDLDVVGMGKD